MEITRIQELAKLVRSERERQGLTQLDLARNADVSRRWLIGLEQGEIGDARLSTILKVTKELGIRLTASTQSRSNKSEIRQGDSEVERRAMPGRVGQGVLASAKTLSPLSEALLALKGEGADSSESSEEILGVLNRLAQSEKFRNLSKANRLSQESAMQSLGALDGARRGIRERKHSEGDGE